jgi:hypothetical protein
MESYRENSREPGLGSKICRCPGARERLMRKVIEGGVKEQ